MIVVDFFIVGALIASLCGALITFPVLGGLFKEQRETIRKMTPERRRSFYRSTAITYLSVGAYFALMLWHPFGLRNTFIYCLIIPFLVLAPLGTLAVGLRSRRRPQRSRQPNRD